jgi:hypothetical protein
MADEPHTHCAARFGWGTVVHAKLAKEAEVHVQNQSAGEVVEQMLTRRLDAIELVTVD